MATATAAPPTRTATSTLRFIEREHLTIAIPAVLGAFLLLVFPVLLAADSWLALVAGRTIAHHGLPHADTLTVYTHGDQWTDQQWLSQLALFGLHELGGMRLVALAFAGLVMAALIVAMAAARHVGASQLAVARIAVPGLASYGLLALPPRTQTFAFVLFAGVLWLLVRDARRPSRHVFWVLPLLVLWANMHGSVLLGAGLVVLRGLCALPDRTTRSRGVLLAVGAVAAIFASPYALELPHYYAATAFNPQFTALVSEWHRTTPSLLTAPFYLLAFAAIWLVARQPQSTTGYEKLVLLATGVMGLMAVRNTAWFALAAVAILPLAMQANAPRDDTRRVPRPVAYAPLLALLAVVVLTVTRPAAWFEHQYPQAVAAAVARSADTNSSARVFSDLRYADWLMWKYPALEGRVAFDARLEMLTGEQLTGIARFLSHTTGRDVTAGYRVLVLDRGHAPAVVVR